MSSADLSPVKQALLAVEHLQAMEKARREPIAVIGIGCRFPGGANGPDAFWQLLADGRETVSESPPDRWDAKDYYDPDPEAPGKVGTLYGSYLRDYDRFDAQFFGISPREAAGMDPQHRLLLEVGWEALENAGQVRERLAASQVGVYVGITANEYAGLYLYHAGEGLARVDAYHSTSSALNTAAGRMAFAYGFRGPCMAIDTACSSSLVAVHQACAALRHGDCEMALAGGVNLIVSPIGSIALTKAGALSPSGQCRTFDAAADGMVRGEGCGLIVLKRLSEAIRDGDHIWAQIRGSAVNHDGPSSGLTVPSGPAQEAVMRQALASAQIKPAEVSYLEAHGTGTPLGDPIEVEAAGAVYGAGRNRGEPLLLGSVKTNIGHAESSAGIAGLIKLVLSLQHERLPAHLHFISPTPHIRWDELPVAVVTKPTPWPRGERPRVGAVSSFGFSGTNAHVIVSEAPTLAAPLRSPAGRRQLLTLSAKSAAALETMAANLRDYLAGHPGAALEDVCFSANVGRLHFDHRLAVIATSAGEAKERLNAFCRKQESPGLFAGRAPAQFATSGAMFFFGPEWSGAGAMVRQLVVDQPVVREAMERSLGATGETAAGMGDTEVARNSFAVEYALSALWQSWGIKPAAAAGMGVGEVAAAWTAGILSLADARAATRTGHLNGQCRQAPTMRLFEAGGREITENASTAALWQKGAAGTGARTCPGWPAECTIYLGEPEPGLVMEEELLTRLANWYVAGGTVDWAGFHRGYPGLRSPLPTTAFQTERYGLDYGRLRQSEREAADKRKTGRHPLLGERLRLAGREKEAWFTVELAADSPAFLEDHSLFGVTVLPAAAYCEMALAGGRAVLGSDKIALRNLNIEEPLILAAGSGKRIQVVLMPAADGLSFRIYSNEAEGEGDWKWHAGGALEAASPDGVAVALGKGDAREAIESAAIYEHYRSHGIVYGDRFRGIVHAWRGGNCAGGSLALPDAAHRTGDRWLLHPVLLDSAFQLLGLALPEVTDDDLYLPIGLERLTLHRAGAVSAEAVVEVHEGPAAGTFVVNVSMTDEAGASIAEVRGMTIRRARREVLRRALSPGQLCYQFLWRPAERATSAALNRSVEWMIFSQAGSPVEDLAERVAAAGARCVCVRPGALFREASPDSFEIDPNERGGFEHLVRAALAAPTGRPLHLVFAWGDPLGGGSPAAGLALGGKGLLYLAQTLSEITLPPGSRLFVLTRGAVSVGTAGESVDPLEAVTWGLGSAIALEMPELSCHRIDFLESTDLENVLAEMSAPGGEDEMAWRGRQAFVPRLGQQLFVPSEVPSRAEGAYLISGGLGALGLQTAQWLAERGARGLVLVGRHEPSEHARQTIRSLEAKGVWVTVVQADVAEFAGAEMAVAAAKALHVSLRGIVHAAGVLEDGVLARQTWESFERVLAPKVFGAWNLHQLTRDIALDFFVCFSSAATVLGSPGQANYVAANSFLDGLAHFRRAQGLPALSVNWGPWGQVGMAARLAGRYSGKGLGLLAPDAALDALGTLLDSQTPQALVASIDWPEVARNLEGRTAPLRFSECLPRDRPAATPAASSIDLRARLEEAAPQSRLELIRTYLRGLLGEVLRLPTETFENDRPLNMLGLDSLMAIELRNRLKREAGVEMTMVEFLTATSLADLATAVAGRLGVSDVASAPSTPPTIEAPDSAGVPGGPGHAVSHGQKALWFLHQADPVSPAYHAAFAARIVVEPDAAALEQVLQLLVQKHAALRTSFRFEHGTVLSVDLGGRMMEMERVDAGGWSDAKLHERVAENYRRPFDLEAGPLFRATLFSRAFGDHVLLLTFHHIICDAWSIWLLLDELRQLYPAVKRGQPAALPPPAASFHDYLNWQGQLLESAEGERLLLYWKETLAGELPPLDFGFGRPEVPSSGLAAATHFFQIPPELMERLKAVAKGEGATLYALLLAAYQVLLHRHTGQEEIIVGSPTTGRSREEFEGVVGYFVNPVAIRGRLGGDPTFGSFLAQMRQTVLDALAHQDLPFPLLVEKLQPRRELGHAPIFQTLFVLQKPQLSSGLADLLVPGGAQPVPSGGLEIAPFPLTQMEGQFDLVLELFENGQGALKYRTAVLTKESTQRMTRHFCRLLESIAADLSQPISSLPMVDGEEQRELAGLGRGGLPLAAATGGLHAIIEAQVERTPGAMALEYEGRQVSYAELNAHANRIARKLRDCGSTIETLVGIYAERSIELVAGLLGILKAGAAYVPLDPSFPAERLSFLLNDSGVKIVLCQRGLPPLVALPGVRLIALDEEPEGESGNLSISVTPAQAAYVIYTSGSTGTPKGALNTHAAICNRLLWMQEQYGLGPADRVLQKTPFSFDVSVWEFFWPLMTGACLVLARPGGHQDRDYLIDLISSRGVTTLHFVPSMLGSFLEGDGVENCRSLRQVFCSGEALPYALQERFFARCEAELHNLYGPTEAAVDVTFWPCERGAARCLVPIGRPIAGTQIYLLDPQLEPVPRGVAGELYIGGEGLARGYIGRAALTAEKFIPNPFGTSGTRLYRTGDSARWLEDGAIEYLGRLDHQVKVRGFRIELGEIEHVLSGHAAVREAAVMVRGEQRLVAYVTLRVGLSATAGELGRHLRVSLPEYMTPAAFVFLETLPLTSNGKLDRRALPDPSGERPEGGTAYVAPRDDIEKTVAAIWQETLGVAKVGRHDNFFELGGHSLLLAQVHVKLQQASGPGIALAELFRFPTVHLLAQRLRGTPGEPTVASRASSRSAGRAALMERGRVRTLHRAQGT